MNAVLNLGGSRLNQLERRMDAAASFEDWHALAEAHDQASGADEWRETAESTLYDWTEIQSRHDKLKRCLEEKSWRELLYALNEGVHGNMGGMGRPILYGRARCGTKQLIDAYVDTICEALDAIFKCPDNIIAFTEKVDFFRRASHCYGRSALLLSGGAGLIYFHHGMVQELVEHDLVPNVISGASAGSIVAAQLGIHTDAELKAGHFVNKRYQEVMRTPLKDVFLGKLSEEDARISKERSLDEMVPRDMTFQDAFERTGRYINVSVSAAEKHQSSRLLNAITSPNVYIRSAISASSSIPGLIPAERLYARGFDGKPRPYLATRRWVDGSVSGDLPAKRLSRLYGVNHFIVSLINPVVVPFVHDVTTRQRRGFRTRLSVSALKMVEESLALMEKYVARTGEAGNRIAAQLAYTMRMLEQDYLGDINVLLRKSDFKWRHTLFDFRGDEIEQLILAGRRTTWPKLAQIRNAAKISNTLDHILEQLSFVGMADGMASKHHIVV